MIKLSGGPTDLYENIVSLRRWFLASVKHPPCCYGQSSSCWFSTSSLFESLNVVQPANETHTHAVASQCHTSFFFRWKVGAHLPSTCSTSAAVLTMHSFNKCCLLFQLGRWQASAQDSPAVVFRMALASY